MKRVVLALIILASGRLFGAEQPAEFHQPEAVIAHFVTSLSNNDFSSALICFAVEEQTARCSYVLYAERLRAVYLPTGILPEGYRELNRVKFLSEAAFTFRSAALVLLETDPGMSQIAENDAREEIQAFIVKTDPEFLKSVQLISAENIAVANGINGTERYIRTMRQRAAVYGADEAADYYIILKRGDVVAECSMMSLLKYNKTWKIQSGYFERKSSNASAIPQ